MKTGALPSHFRMVPSFAVVLVSACTALPPPQEWWREEGPGLPLVYSPPPSVLERNIVPLENLFWAQSLEIARENSPRVSQAKARMRRAEAALREAKSSALPRVDARGNVVRFVEGADFRGRDGSNVSGVATRTRFVTGRSSDIYNGGVDMSYPIFDGGAAYYARRAAEASLDASEHDRETALVALELQVSESFLEVLLADGAIEIAAEAVALSEEQETRARIREEAGEGLKVDRLRFAALASEQRLGLNRARAERKVRVAVLGELMGVKLSDDVHLDPPSEELGSEGGDHVAIALRERSELRALDSLRTEARRRLSKESAAWWPRADVFGSYGVISLDDLEFGQDEDEFQIGGTLAWTLFDGFARDSREAAARAEIDELEAVRRELTLAIEREVRQVEVDLGLARENVEVSRETLRLAEEVLERVNAQYEAGEAQVIDVNEAQLQLTRSRLELLRSRVELLAAQSRLRRVTGKRIAVAVKGEGGSN